MKHIKLASVSVLAICAVPAFAQTAPAAADDQGGIPDIIVTAQRTSESAQKAPIAIAVVQPEDIVRQNVTRAEDLARVVPALVAQATGGPNTSFFVRGVGNTTNNSYSDPAISFNYDGVNIGRPNATQGFFFDLQRVEVLKGPQGTLYGRNATGGAINIIPARPVIGELGGQFSVSYGNYNAYQSDGAINVPIGENGAFRLSAASSSHDGYMSDGTSDQRSLSVRGQVLAELTSNLTTRIGVDFSHQGGAGTGSFVYGTYAANTTTGLFEFTPLPQFGPSVGVHSAATEAFVQTRFIAQAGRNNDATGTYPTQDNSVWGFTSETNWTTDIGTLTLQGGYRESGINSLSTTSNFRGLLIDEDVQQVTLEARFAGKVGTVADFLVGAFLYDEDINNRTVINQLVTTPFQNYKTGTNSKAVFGKFGLHVSDTFTITAAGRYTDDKKYMDGLSNVYTINCGNPAPPQDFCDGRPGSTVLPIMPLVRTAAEVIAFYTARGIPVGNNGVNPAPLTNTPRVLNTQIAINSVLETKKFTYRLAADWEVTPSNLLYASYETGFHSGGFNFGRGRETYRPEEIEAFTIGSKNRFFNNKVQLNIEAFYWKYRDQQIAQFGTDFSTPPITVFYTDNIGRSTIKGFDIDLDALITPTTRFSGSVQYLDNKYDSYTINTAQAAGIPNFACPYTAVAAVPASGTTPAVAAQWRVDCAGKPGLFAPKWSFNVNLEQTFQLNDYQLVAQVGTRYRGDFFATTSYQAWTVSEAAFQSDASLTLRPDGKRWFVTAFINNIEDKRRLVQSQVNGSLGAQSGVSSAPRTFGLRLGGKF